MMISLLVVIVDFGVDGCCCWGYGWLLRLVLVWVVWCVLFCVGVVTWVFSLLLLFVCLFIAMPLTCRGGLSNLVCFWWFGATGGLCLLSLVVFCFWMFCGGVLILWCYNTTL